MRYIALGILLLAGQSHAADQKLMHRILMCESSFRPDAIGDDGVSRGIAQFRKETFYEFAEMAQIERIGFGKPRWINPQQQIYLLAWGLDHGYGNRWTCYRKIKKEIK